jgi:hypothetical protein
MAQKPQGTGQDQAGDMTRQHQQQSDPDGQREKRIEETRREIMGDDGQPGRDQAR